MQKQKKKQNFEIQSHFSYFPHSDSLKEHVKRGEGILKKILPEEFFDLSISQMQTWLQRKLPILDWTKISEAPDCLTLYFFCAPNQEVKAEKILPDLIRKWLIPEKEVHILGFENLYFTIKGIHSKLYFLSKIQVLIERDRDLLVAREHLPLLANELILSMNSSKYLERILDTKALSLDQKSTQIQQYLRKLSLRSPEQFDFEIFREMSTFFALSKSEFRSVRMPKHLTRLIVSHFLARKRLRHVLSISPEKRHLEFRFIRSKLHFPFGVKPVLGVSIAVSLADRYESFEDTHIIAAAQKFIPELKMVKGSYYFYRANHDPIKNIYLELEKNDGSRFTKQELQILRRELKEELKIRIEKLIPSVFMIRNEEEIMRNILLLSQELKYFSDIPQVMINFESQDANELCFTVLVVRIVKKKMKGVEDDFKRKKLPLRFISDRVQNVGFVRKKNPKEANVFHLYIPKDRSILRADSSVNFYSARQKVISLLNEVLGEIRDYNGGMILKQGELFSQFRHTFSSVADKNQEFLENFFFSLNPIEAQATTTLSSLKTLFNLFLEIKDVGLVKRESFVKKIKKQKNKVFAVVRAKDSSLENFLNQELNCLEDFSKFLIRAQLRYQGTTFYGFIYKSDNTHKLKTFEALLSKATEGWVSKIVHQQQLRLSFADLPPSLDPRLWGDDVSSCVMKLLFEGLTRIVDGKKLALALAKSIHVSADQKQYTFKLRPSFWSDGSPLVAYDFEYAWKKILTPSFYMPFSYFLHPIKNARLAKEGKIGIEKVGVKAIDEFTLVVDLENPTPEFLEYIARPLYSPIHHKVDKLHPNWSQGADEQYVCNGPFKLRKGLHNGGYEFEKNPLYWDSEAIKLDQIFISKNNTETALEMFKNGEIDWIGHPMHPWENYFNEIDIEKAHTNYLGVNWCVFNSKRFPFDNLKMRKAFTYATNRKQLAALFPGTKPAKSPLPYNNSLVEERSNGESEPKIARALFEEALKEMGLSKSDFPVISLCYIKAKRRELAAKNLIKQWEEILGISCRLEKDEFQGSFSKMIKGEFQIGTISWKSWINNAFYTLEVFRNQNNRVNFSKWENSKYQILLDKAEKEIVISRRRDYLKQAEELLILDCPVIPLNYEKYQFMKNPSLKGVWISETGNLDFSRASIIPN